MNQVSLPYKEIAQMETVSARTETVETVMGDTMKKTVLIVDDDANFRYAIRELVPWKKEGFEIIGEAIHGKQAWDILKKSPCDIVLTDMEMPLMDGVALTKQIKQKDPDTIVVAMSAYDDFSFVKESMRLGASDYILKQYFEPGQLLELLKQLSNEQDTRRQTDLMTTKNRDFLIRYLKGQGMADKAPDFLKDKRNMVVFLVEHGEGAGLSNISISSDFRFLLSAKLPNVRYLFIADMLQYSGAADRHASCRRAAEALGRLFQSGAWVGYSENGASFDELPQSYSRADAALFYKLYEPKRRIYCYEEYREKEASRNPGYVFKPPYEERDEGKLLALMTDVVREKLPDVNALLASFVTLYRRFHEYNALPIVDVRFKEYYDRIKECPTFDEMCSVYLAETEKSRREQAETAGLHREIRIAREYIAEHYNEDITLGEISEFTGLSENYFSYLFKKETGVALKAYINEVRMKEAKRLLMETSLRDYEIAEQVGYHNAAYFASLFKRICGESVSDYRRHRT